MAKSKTAGKTKSKGKRARRAKDPAARPAGGPGREPKVSGGQAAAERQAVVILPMHRSGSSALSRVLSLLGCDLPKTLMGGNETNPTGHWESTVVRALNDDVLASGGSQWQDWQAFNPNWYKTPKPREFQARALEILQDEFGASSLFVFKDPRVCRIFPFWRDTFAVAGIAPKIILTVRHPQEVAASLERRKDNGIPALVGLLLWLRYMLEAEADSRGMTRAFVSYDRLLRDPVGVAESLQDRLGLFWPSLSELQADEIRGYVDPTLRHHDAVAGAGLDAVPDFREWLDGVYEIFLRWCRDGEDGADHPALDAVRTRLNDLAGPLHRVVDTVTAQAGELARKTEEIDALSATHRTTVEELAAARAGLETLEEEKTGLQNALEETRSARDAAWADKDRLAQELSQRDDTVEELQGRLQSLTSALEQRSHEAEETAKALKEAQAQVAQQAQEAEALRATLAEARAEGEADAARIAALQAELEDRHRTLEERGQAVTQLREKASRLDAEATAQAGDLAQMAQLILEKEEALKRRNAAAHEARDQATGLQQDVARLQAELEARDQALAEVEAHRQALLGSTSWRVTAPLRRILMMLKR